MHESMVIPACFTGEKQTTDDPSSVVTRAGQSVYMSTYQTKVAGQCRLITITWCKNMLLHGLSVSVEGSKGDENRCKVELKPWYFWKKQGSKTFMVEGKIIGVVWDLRTAKFNGETEPQSDFYVAIVHEDEVVLLVGDLKKNAYQKTKCRPALIDPILVSRKEHLFGKRKFSTRVKFEENGTRFHMISIECVNNGTFSGETDQQMEVKIDGNLAIHVKHLQWKFRGNESIKVGKNQVEVYWDVHDWLFSTGPRNGLFIFKPTSSLSSSSSSSSSRSRREQPSSSATTIQTAASLGSILMTTQAENSSSETDESCVDSIIPTSLSRFCLFVYAWKVE